MSAGRVLLHDCMIKKKVSFDALISILKLAHWSNWHGAASQNAEDCGSRRRDDKETSENACRIHDILVGVPFFVIHRVHAAHKRHQQRDR